MPNDHAIAPVGDINGGGLLAFIERAARDPEFDVAKFRELLLMRREELDAQAKREFNTAMRNAQAQMEPVTRNARNDHTSSKYARLETIDQQMRPVYTAHGFSVRYGSAAPIQSGWIRITCTVAHVGGYFEDHFLDAPLDRSGSQGKANKTEVQAVGSTVTYLRRYLLGMVFNIVLSDDDDDGAGKRARRKPQDDTAPPDDPLTEINGPKWQANLRAALAAAETVAAMHAIRQHPNVHRTLQDPKTPLRVRREIEDDFRKAFERLAPNGDGEETDWNDPLADLLREVETMDLVRINALPTDAQWRARVRVAAALPLDEDRLAEAIEARRQALRPGTEKQ